jgi:hypothetical protein
MKVDNRLRRYINTALIIGPMTLIVAFVGVLRNYGMVQGWILKSFFTWFTTFPVAYVCALFIIPIANRVTSKINFKD